MLSLICTLFIAAILHYNSTIMGTELPTLNCESSNLQIHSHLYHAKVYASAVLSTSGKSLLDQSTL